MGLYYLNSRYYDSNTGRFINADVYVNANGDIVGFNMYVYCSNNPVNFIDPTGQWTISFGKNFSAYIFSGVAYSWNIVIDSSGNIAYQVSKANVFGGNDGVVVGIASLGVSRSITYTNFDTYNNLEGPGVSAGGSVSFGPVAVGGELITPMDDFEIVGGTLSLGTGLGSPVDVNMTASITETKWHFNIYEVGNKIKNAWNSFWNGIGG